MKIYTCTIFCEMQLALLAISRPRLFYFFFKWKTNGAEMADHIEFVIIGLLWKAITYCIFDFDPFFSTKVQKGKMALLLTIFAHFCWTLIM